MIPSTSRGGNLSIEGARAIGLGDQIGSFEPGKQADLILVDLDQLNLSPVVRAPIRNIVPNLVYAATGHDVDSVMVAGRFVMRGREILTADDSSVRAEAQAAAEEISRRVSSQTRSTRISCCLRLWRMGSCRTCRKRSVAGYCVPETAEGLPEPF